MRALAEIVRRFLSRHGRASGRTDNRPQKQQWRIFKAELSLGDDACPGSEQTAGVQMKTLPFVFDEDEHVYTIKKTGEEVPSCSRILDIGGFDSYANVRADILERKSAIGREVHRATVLYDRGVLDWSSVDRRVVGYVRSYVRFGQATGFRPTAMEVRSVVDVDGRKYGLTIDRMGLTKSRIRRGGFDTVVELKTTVSPARRHHLQTAGYAIGYPKRGFATPLARFYSRRRIIVYLKPKGDPDIVEANCREDYFVFMSLLTISEYKLRHEPIERAPKWQNYLSSRRNLSPSQLER